LRNEITTSGLAATIGPIPVSSDATAQSTVPNNIVVQINGPIGEKLLVAGGYLDDTPNTINGIDAVGTRFGSAERLETFLAFIEAVVDLHYNQKRGGRII
jgi:hypothetical protein